MEPAKLTEKQREANRLLAGPARNIMLRGGSRSGKTFILVRALIQRAINAPGSRHVIFRFRFNHAKTSVWSDTLPKVLSLCFPTIRARFDKTDFYVELPNGSQVWIGGLDDKERVEKILGQEYATLYFNESSQIPWASVETAMSRLAQKCKLAPAIALATGRTFLALKAYFDCNPPSKLHWSYQMFRAKMKPGTKETLAKPEDYVEMQVNPADNVDNLPAEYFDVLASMSAAKRLRFEAGEWASEVSGALWALEDRKAPDGKTMPGIDSLRVASLPEMRRIVVSIDPSGTRGDDGGDDIGIIVAGLGVDGHGYIIEDGTCQMSPEGWGRRAVDLYHRHGAHRIIGERNFGGDMVRFTVSTADKRAAFKEVVASRGKAVRAEPISALYEQGKVHHVGTFPDLEDQMCLAAGTLIETDRGQIPIEEINTQDRVLTRKGFAPVKWAGYTGDASEFIEIGTGTCLIRATKSHPIFDTVSDEFVSAARVNPTHRLLVSRNWDDTVSPLHGEGDGTTVCRPGIIDTPKVNCFIEKSMSSTMAPFHKGWISIMWTVIRGTTFLTTLRFCREQATRLLMNLRASPFLVTCPSLGRASFAGKSLRQAGWSPAITARTAATCDTIGQTSPANLRSLSHASGAAPQASTSAESGFVHGSARTISTLRNTSGEREPVYNLSVADGFLPEFFANGILVHNCNFTASGYLGEGSPDRADALVWAITELMITGSAYNIRNMG